MAARVCAGTVHYLSVKAPSMVRKLVQPSPRSSQLHTSSIEWGTRWRLATRLSLAKDSRLSFIAITLWANLNLPMTDSNNILLCIHRSYCNHNQHTKLIHATQLSVFGDSRWFERGMRVVMLCHIRTRAPGGDACSIVSRNSELGYM